MCDIGKEFDCSCGDNYAQMVEDFQLTAKSDHEIFEYKDDDLIQVIQHQNQIDRRLGSKIVKLHDIVANYQRGTEDVSKFVRKVVKALFGILQNSNESSCPFFCDVISSAFTNYHKQYQDILNEEFFEKLKQKPVKLPLSSLTNLGFESFIQSILKFAGSGSQIFELLHLTEIPTEQLQETSKRLLFRISGLETWQMYINLVCFLTLQCDNDAIKDLFSNALTLWSDPIISKAYVYREVIHYTKLCLMFFSHFSPQFSVNLQDLIIKFVAQVVYK